MFGIFKKKLNKDQLLEVLTVSAISMPDWIHSRWLDQFGDILENDLGNVTYGDVSSELHGLVVYLCMYRISISNFGFNIKKFIFDNFCKKWVINENVQYDANFVETKEELFEILTFGLKKYDAFVSKSPPNGNILEIACDIIIRQIFYNLNKKEHANFISEIRHSIKFALMSYGKVIDEMSNEYKII